MNLHMQTQIIDRSLILRLTVALILLMHSVPGMFNGGIDDFGKLYLDQAGFAPFGLALAWAIKLSHVVCAVLLVMNRFIKAATLVSIAVLVMGIIMVHAKAGWFVVGGGSNGIEFNLLLISVLLYLLVSEKKH